MDTKKLCTDYLAALNEANVGKVLSLFTTDAVVVSPLYGQMDVAAFFYGLFADTNRSVTTLLNVFEADQDPSSLALHFHYRWTLKSGKVVEFDCVDVFKLTAACDKFTKLTIIYDTAPLQATFNESRVLRQSPPD